MIFINLLFMKQVKLVCIADVTVCPRFLTPPQHIKKGVRGAKPGVPHQRRAKAKVKVTSAQSSAKNDCTDNSIQSNTVTNGTCASPCSPDNGGATPSSTQSADKPSATASRSSSSDGSCDPDGTSFVSPGSTSCGGFKLAEEEGEAEVSLYPRGEPCPSLSKDPPPQLPPVSHNKPVLPFFEEISHKLVSPQHKHTDPLPVHYSRAPLPKKKRALLEAFSPVSLPDNEDHMSVSYLTSPSPGLSPQSQGYCASTGSPATTRLDDNIADMTLDLTTHKA